MAEPSAIVCRSIVFQTTALYFMVSERFFTHLSGWDTSSPQRQMHIEYGESSVLVRQKGWGREGSGDLLNFRA